MRLLAVTTCTDRKRFEVSRRLSARSLSAGSLDDVVGDWLDRLSETRPVASAEQVYCGRAFQEALAAAHSAGTELHVISGGLGLVPATSRIPAYSLALSPGSADFIGSRITPEPFRAPQWWQRLVPSSPRPLTTLLQQNRDAICAIAVSRSYMSLIVSELAELADEHIARIRLIGLSLGDHVSGAVRKHVLPYDDRLDGPDSALKGTRADFAQRALRHFVERIWKQRPGGTLEQHRRDVERALAGWRRAPTFQRTPKSDDEIKALIRHLWRRAKGQSGRMLRLIRDHENVACEQGRFRGLFRAVADERAA